MTSQPIGFNVSTTTVTSLSSSSSIGLFGKQNRAMVSGGKLPAVRPTVSLDARPIVIPILSCVICFPVLAFAIICALRYRGQRLRRRDQLKRIQSGFRSVTLDIPARGGEKSSFYSKDSSSDPPSLRPEPSQAPPDSPPDFTLDPSTSSSSNRRSSRTSQHVKFVTTTAVLHGGRTVTGLGHGRFKTRRKSSSQMFWDERSSHVESVQDLERELSLTLDS